MSPHLLREQRAYVQLETERAIYGMLLFISDTQPVENLPWWEIGMVEDGANEMALHLSLGE